MSRALVTLATGPHTELLEIALPSFEEFADRHGYDVVIPDVECDRPPSWWKVAALRAALQEYDEALWVDADVVITDPSEDMEVPDGCWQALVRHHTADGEVPNCAVWLVRRPMVEVLEQLWRMTHRLEHGWWEQAAMLDLLGYIHHLRPQGKPSFLAVPSELYRRTCWLDNGWNVHLWDTPGAERPRFMHATMHANRARVMREWAAGRVPAAPPSVCRHLYPIDDCDGCVGAVAA